MSKEHTGIGGKAIIVVGGTGMGKTTFVKKCLSMVNKELICLYDPNDEYHDFREPNYILPEFDVFCMRVNSLRQSVIVYEEASMFLSNRGSNTHVLRQLVQKRHKQNTFFLVFHSVRKIPKYLLDMCNMIVLHKTADPLEIVESLDCPELTAAFIELKSAAMLTSANGGLYSPSKVVHLIS